MEHHRVYNSIELCISGMLKIENNLFKDASESKFSLSKD